MIWLRAFFSEILITKMFSSQVYASALLLCIVFNWVFADLPSYDSPETSEPKLLRPVPEDILCEAKISVISSAMLMDYNQVFHENFSMPSECEGPWERVIIDFDGSVSGVQFDRFGAFWIDGIELLRTSTPEPSSSGIHWHIEKDMTQYQDVLLANENHTSTILIPNVVNAEFDGILFVNVSISIYSTKENPSSVPKVISLENFVNKSSLLLGISGDERRDYMIPPMESTFLTGFIDLALSAHGDEEFWYSNLPDTFANNNSMPGGGSFREIQVFIDGFRAGCAFPFPVIYSGGINPFLWRPVAGIISFDIPFYRMDITPFMGLLIGGGEHNVSVVITNNSKNGYWIINSALLLFPFHARTNQGGKVTKETTDGPFLSTISKIFDSQDETFETNAQHSCFVEGDILLNDMTVIKASVHSELVYQNLNAIYATGESQKTIGVLRYSTQSFMDFQNGSYLQKIARYTFPFNIFTRFVEDSDSMQIEATVQISRDRKNVWEDENSQFQVNWIETYDGSAIYNRSLRNRFVHVGKENSSSSFDIVNPDCYHKILASRNGKFTIDMGMDRCQWGRSLFFCGSEVCSVSYFPDLMQHSNETQRFIF